MTTTARFFKEQTASILHGDAAAVIMMTMMIRMDGCWGWCWWWQWHDMMIMITCWWWNVQYWKNCLVDTYTNKLNLSLFESRWTHIHCLVFRSKTNNFQLIKPLPEGGGGGQSAKRFFRPQFGLKIRGGGVSPAPFPWFRHCKLTKSARYFTAIKKQKWLTGQDIVLQHHLYTILVSPSWL